MLFSLRSSHKAEHRDYRGKTTMQEGRKNSVPGVSTMSERHIHLATLFGSLAVIGAIIGYLREASFSGMLAGAIFLLVVGGIVGLLFTDSRSPVR